MRLCAHPAEFPILIVDVLQVQIDIYIRLFYSESADLMRLCAHPAEFPIFTATDVQESYTLVSLGIDGFLIRIDVDFLSVDINL